MTLAARLADLATRVAAECKSIRALASGKASQTGDIALITPLSGTVIEFVGLPTNYNNLIVNGVVRHDASAGRQLQVSFLLGGSWTTPLNCMDSQSNTQTLPFRMAILGHNRGRPVFACATAATGWASYLNAPNGGSSPTAETPATGIRFSWSGTGAFVSSGGATYIRLMGG